MNRSKKLDPRQWVIWENSGAVSISTVDYSKPVVPTKYKCSVCGATNCKLWREYQTFSPRLMCARCAAKDQGKNISDIDADGKRSRQRISGMRTDQIGWFVPAVPDEEGLGYWGYTSVPPAGCAWWRNLPTLPDRAA